MNEKEIQRYLKAIRRRLNLPGEIRDRVISDLRSSIQERREAGQTDREILAELGTPAQAAADLNRQMEEFTYVKSPWRWLCLVLAIGSGLSLLWGGGLSFLTWLLNRMSQAEVQSIGIIGGADGPTTVFVTTSPDAMLYQLGMCLLLLVMGILGFRFLSRCQRNKKPEEPGE